MDLLKRKIILIILAVFIATSIGCSNKKKDAMPSNNKDVVVEQNTQKEDPKKDNEIVERENSKDTISNPTEGNKDTPVDDSQGTSNTDSTNTDSKVNGGNNTTVDTKPVETKPEVSKPQPPKEESPAPEVVKPEEPELPEQEQPKTEEPKQETETPKQEPESPKPEEVKPEQKVAPVKDIADKVKKELGFSMMMEMAEEQAKEFYALDPSLVSEYAINVAMINVRSDEVAIFKVKDKNDIDKVKAGILKRHKSLDNVWKQYLPDQYEKVKNYLLIEKDNYIMFCVSGDQNKAKEIFYSFFK